MNPKNLESIEGMNSSTCNIEVQSLNGKLAALNSFLANSRDTSLPLFQVLRAYRNFERTPKCEKMFQDLKQHLRTLPPLAKPTKGNALSLYYKLRATISPSTISISPVAVSFVLLKEIAKGQVPMYNISKVLIKIEMYYQKLRNTLIRW